MISAITNSTTLRVLENGALKTATPRRAALATSIWLVPMQNAPTASRRGDFVEHHVRDPGPGPDAEQIDIGDAVNQLALAEGAAKRLHVETGRREPRRRTRVDVLQQDGSAAGGALLVHASQRYLRSEVSPVRPGRPSRTPAIP